MSKHKWNHQWSHVLTILLALQLSHTTAESSHANKPPQKTPSHGIQMINKSNFSAGVSDYIKLKFDKTRAQRYKETLHNDKTLGSKLTSSNAAQNKRVASNFSVNNRLNVADPNPIFHDEPNFKTAHRRFGHDLSPFQLDQNIVQPYPVHSHLIFEKANTYTNLQMPQNFIKPNSRFIRNTEAEHNETNIADIHELFNNNSMMTTITSTEEVNSSIAPPEVTTQMSNYIKRNFSGHDFHSKLVVSANDSLKEPGPDQFESSTRIHDTVTTQTFQSTGAYIQTSDNFSDYENNLQEITRKNRQMIEETSLVGDDDYKDNNLLHQRYIPDENTNSSIETVREFYSNDTYLQIYLSHTEDSMMVTWLFESNDTRITGFQVSYRVNKRENYDSSNLGLNVRLFTLHSLHEDEDYVICVHAMVYDTIVKESCDQWFRSSLKIVVGILAGTIFLLPCLVIIAWILYKDHQIKKRKLKLVDDGENTICNEQLIVAKNPKNDNDVKLSAELDGAEKGIKFTESNSSKSLNTPQHDIGHENPCQHAADDATEDDNINGPWRRLSEEGQIHL